MIDTLAAQISTLFSQGQQQKHAAEEQLKQMIAAALEKSPLVSQEAFDAQAQVLLKTREKLEALEAKVALLESQLEQS